MADVFVSYKKEEHPHAQRVIAALAAEGYTTWWDDRLNPAEHWDEVIEREISAARAVVVLWTPSSAKSQWVRSEAEFAKKAGKLVPIVLTECELPISFSLVQAVDLTRWSGRNDDRNWMKLAAWIRDLVSSAKQQHNEPSAGPVRADWRAAFGAHVNGEPILDGKTITRSAPPGTLFRDAADLPLMCVVQGGRFTMGAPASEADSVASERPQRQLSIGGSFALGVYTVTFDEWEAAKRNGGVSYAPHDGGFGRGRMPVTNVSHADAQSYVQWLSNKTAETYRLPSEAEWEYACRAGSPAPYSFEGPCTAAFANYSVKKPAPVGSFPANRFGLHDMHGNVREWVGDLWHDNYNEAPGDAITWTSGHGALRVVRGGGWPDAAKFLRSASRGRAGAAERCGFIGFRVAREIS